MAKIYCYGEDALTLWALNNCIKEILEQIKDNTPPQNCSAFYRPSFGRGAGPLFGEFDAILIAKNDVYLNGYLNVYLNVYLIESKWDSLRDGKKSEEELKEFYSNDLKKEKLRHEIFTWYVEKWSKEYINAWEKFRERYQDEFKRNFDGRMIPGAGSLLAQNLEYILKSIKEVFQEPCSVRNVFRYCNTAEKTDLPDCQERCSVRNVFLYFYRKGKSVKLERLLEEGEPSNFFASIVNIDYTPALYDDSNFILISQK